VCSVLVYVGLYADVNRTQALSLDTKDWNVPFFLHIDFYMYIVFYHINYSSPVSLFISIFLAFQAAVCIKLELN